MALLALAIGGQACGGQGGSSAGLNAEGGAGGTGNGGSSSSTTGTTNSSGSSATAGSGNTGSSGSSSGGTSSSGGGDGSVGSCLGASVLSALGKDHLLVGVSTGDAPTVAGAPFDIRYEYISGGLFDGQTPCTSCATNCTAKGHTCANSMGQGGCVWWGCYQNDMKPPGLYVSAFDVATGSTKPAHIPMFTYYELLQTALDTLTGFQSGKQEATVAATNVSLMTRYFNDWRFFLQQVGQTVAILHIEPDFWGLCPADGLRPDEAARRGPDGQREGLRGDAEHHRRDGPVHDRHDEDLCAARARRPSRLRVGVQHGRRREHEREPRCGRRGQ